MHCTIEWKCKFLGNGVECQVPHMILCKRCSNKVRVNEELLYTHSYWEKQKTGKIKSDFTAEVLANG